MGGNAQFQDEPLAKAKAKAKAQYAHNPQPSFTTYGPTNRREVLQLFRMTGGKP